ncbi:MAG: hemerythrin domain-containing protein [Anaerolineae bacterium]
MRITKILRKGQETILRFLNAFGGGSVALGANNRYATPGFFIYANTSIRGYIENVFFKKEELLLKALAESGLPTEEGPFGAMKKEQEKSKETADLLFKAAPAWQAGEADARVEVGWAASEYTALLWKHLERLRTLVFPLLEQNLLPEDERKMAEGLNSIVFAEALGEEGDPYLRLIEALEEELADWK